MKFLKAALHFYINASIHVGFSVIALAQISAIGHRIDIPMMLSVFIFCSTVVAYNFIRYFDLFKKKRLVYSPFTYSMLVFTFCMLIIGGYSFLFLSGLAQLLALLALVLVLLYSLPLNKTSESFRNYGGIKTYMVALSWTIVTVGLPFSFLKPTWEVLFWMTLIQFVFVLIAIQPFDIRDMNIDQVSLKTWPQRFGIRKTQWLSSVLVVLMVLTMFFFSPLKISFIIPTVFAFLLLVVFLWKSTPKQGVYFSSLWVEGIPVFWWTLYQTFFLYF